MPSRHRALDVFRGATVALMILVNNPGSWSHLYPPLAHAPWHGCTPTDLVFPFFLFAVGNALAFTLPGLQALGPAAFGARWARRVAVIFGLGLFLNFSPFVRWDPEGALAWRSLESLRVLGVLQRIALCWGAAALLLWVAGARAALALAAALLLGYWGACLAFGASGDPYSLEGFFGTGLDRALLGASHLYRGEGVPFDPEGLASTVPAIAQVLLGFLVGQRIARAPLADARLLGDLVVTAVVLGALAYLWQLAMPLNKKLWTSSYVLLTSGLACLLLAALIRLLDPATGAAAAAARAGLASRLGDTAAAWCEAFGKNALGIFVLSGFVPRVLALLRWEDGQDGEGRPRWMSPLPWLYRTVFAPLASDPRLGSLLHALALLAAYTLVAVWLDRRRIYLRA